MTYEFIVKNEDGEIVFAVIKPTLEMLEEEIGRWQRNKEDIINLD